jgi:hypothetical protein
VGPAAENQGEEAAPGCGLGEMADAPGVAAVGQADTGRTLAAGDLDGGLGRLVQGVDAEALVAADQGEARRLALDRRAGGRVDVALSDFLEIPGQLHDAVGIDPLEAGPDQRSGHHLGQQELSGEPVQLIR